MNTMKGMRELCAVMVCLGAAFAGCGGPPVEQPTASQSQSLKSGGIVVANACEPDVPRAVTGNGGARKQLQAEAMARNQANNLCRNAHCGGCCTLDPANCSYDESSDYYTCEV